MGRGTPTSTAEATKYAAGARLSPAYLASVTFSCLESHRTRFPSCNQEISLPSPLHCERRQSLEIRCLSLQPRISCLIRSIFPAPIIPSLGGTVLKMDSTPYSPIATGFGEDDDIVEFEENMFSTTDVPEQRPRAEESEREKWESQRFSSKFRVVMLDLKDSVRWDDSYGSPSTPVIEDYKKEALLTGSERGDNTNPTFFQMLARYTDEFAYLSAGARRAVIRTIVAFKEKEKAARGTSEEEVSGQPALNLAVKFDNDEFIDCVMECWPSGFSELIDMQDNEGENCLHLVFALPDLGRATKAGIKAARDAALSRGQKIIPKARAESLAAVDRDGNTPIHHAMHYLMCSNRGEDYINLVKTMIIKGDKIMMANRGPINRRKESPLLYCSRTLKVIRDAKQRAEVAASQRSAAARQAPNPKDNVNGARDQRDTKPRNTEEGQDGKMMMAANRGRPMQQPGVDKISVLLRGGQERPMGSAETSNLYRGTAINRPGSPAASVGKPESYPGKGAETRPQVAQPPNQSAGKTPAPAADESKSSARILIDFLTRHYIRTRTDFDARNLIYGVNSSGELYWQVRVCILMLSAFLSEEGLSSAD